MRRLTGHTNWVESVAFSPDGTRIATGSKDLTVKLWDAATGEETRMFRGRTGPVTSVAFSPDGTRIASGGEDRTLRVWDSAIGPETLTITEGGSPLLAFSPEERRLPR